MTVPEEGVMGDRLVHFIVGDLVLTMVVHAALCMTGTMDRAMTNAGALIMAGLGALIMVCRRKSPEHGRYRRYCIQYSFYLQHLCMCICCFTHLVFICSVLYLQSFTDPKVKNLNVVHVCWGLKQVAVASSCCFLGFGMVSIHILIIGFILAL